MISILSMTPLKKYLVIIFSLVVLVTGLIAAIVLVRQRQLPAKKAAVPGGIAQVRLDPDTQTVNVDQTFTVDIPFTTGGATISAITVQLDYGYSGADPPLTVTDIQVNPTLAATGYWSFPIQTFAAAGGNARVRIAGINTSMSGYSSGIETVLATLTFRAQSAGSISVSFDSTQSKITDKATAEDILLIPTSTGSYTALGDVEPTSTPTSTSTHTPTPTVSDGQGGGVIITATPTPSELPDAGVGLPTLAFLAIGAAFLLGGWWILLVV